MKSLALLSILLVGCVQALSSVDVASLHDAQRVDLAIYRDVDSGEARALARASFCSSEAVLRRNDASAIDSGGSILCEAPK